MWQSVYFPFVETFQRNKRPLHRNVQPPEPYSPKPGLFVRLPHVFLLFRRLRLLAGIPPRRRQVETRPAQSVFTARANGRPIIDRAVTFPANVPPGTSSAFDLHLDGLPVVYYHPSSLSSGRSISGGAVSIISRIFSIFSSVICPPSALNPLFSSVNETVSIPQRSSSSV